MEYIKVKDLFTISKGKKVEGLEYKTDESVRYIQIDDLRNNENLKYCENNTKYVFANKEDIIIAWDGANAGTIGFGLEGAIGSTLAVLRKKFDYMDSEFCGLFLRSKSNYLREKCTGATIPHIQKSVLENIEIPKFDINTQKKIVEVLDKAQELIDKRKEQIEALDELVKSRFIEIFGDLYNNTKGWRKETFGEIVTIERGGSPRPINEYITDDINGINWIKIGDTSQNSMYIKSTKEKIKPEGIKKSRYVKEGDLLLSNSMSFGRPYILKTDGCIHDGWLVIRDDYSVFNKIYLCTALGSEAIYNQFKSMAVGGVVNNLNKEMVKGLSVCIPPIELQNQFADFVKQVDKLKSKMESSLKELEDNFNSLMQKAFKGELF